jgi:FlaA1/EpsC-like NDP-sugar epimerase
LSRIRSSPSPTSEAAIWVGSSCSQFPLAAMPNTTTFNHPEKRAGVRAFLHRQLFVTPPLPHDVDLRGKTAIVTGSNAGIGLECARQLLDLGVSKLIIAVRNETKGEAARKNLLSEGKFRTPLSRSGRSTLSRTTQ